MKTSDDEFNNDLIEPIKKTFTIETSNKDEFYQRGVDMSKCYMREIIQGD